MNRIIPFVLILSLIFEPAYAMKSCQCVAFRMDDVQDYWISDTQIDVMDIFHKKHSKLTIGIIGNIFGDDQKLVNYIKNRIHNKSGDLEIANHGWNHEDFATFNKTQQSDLMKNTNEKLYELFGIKPSIFIPPYDSFNNVTTYAMNKNNLDFISSDVDQDIPNLRNDKNLIYHIPGNAKTSNLIENDTKWYLYNHDHVFFQIMHNIQKYGYAVVVLHPQEYLIQNNLNYSDKLDKNKIKELELLIDEVKNSGIKITLLNQIPFSMNKKPNPSWIDHVFNLYSNGQISYHDVVSNIHYLTSKKIINYS